MENIKKGDRVKRKIARPASHSKIGGSVIAIVKKYGSTVAKVTWDRSTGTRTKKPLTTCVKLSSLVKI